MKRSERSRIEITVNPKIRMLWDEMPEGRKKIIKKMFEKSIVDFYLAEGGDADVLDEIGNLTLIIEYGEKTLEALKALIAEASADMALKKEVKELLTYIVNALHSQMCEYGGLGLLKKKAKELLDKYFS